MLRKMLLGLIVLTSALWYLFDSRLPSPPAKRSDPESYFAFSAMGAPFFSLIPFDFLCRLELFRTDPTIKKIPFSWEAHKLVLSFFSNGGVIHIHEGAKNLWRFPLYPLVNKANLFLRESPGNSVHEIPQEILTYDWEESGLRGRLMVYNLSGKVVGKTVQVDHIKSDLLLNFNEKRVL